MATAGSPAAGVRERLSARARDYYDSHAIDAQVAADVGVRELGDGLLFPYCPSDGSTFVRRRSLNGAGGKVSQPPGTPLALWWPAGRPSGADLILVTEGESDALAALSALKVSPPAVGLRDLPVAAVPGTGYPVQRLVDELSQVGSRRVLLAFDGDQAGRRYTAKASKSLATAGIRAIAVDLPDGSDLSDHLAVAEDPADRLANALVDAEVAADSNPLDARRQSVTPGKLRRLDVGSMTREPPPPVPWVIEGLVARGMLTVLNGREGEGKSLLALALTAGVATAQDEAGLMCHAGRVVVVDAENGQSEIHRRVRTLELPAEGIECFEAQGFDLRRDLPELDAILEEHEPDMLVLDSFRSLWGGEENDSGEVAAALDPLRNLVRRHNAGTLLLHHSGKLNGAYRGSSAIGASAELGFKLAREDGDDDPTRCYLETWKCRPAQRPPRRWLRLAVERGRVFIDAAEPSESEEPKAPAPVRAELAPALLDRLTFEPQTRADLARAVDREPKDRSVGRVLAELVDAGDAQRTDDGWRRVAGGTTPIGGSHPATPQLNPHSRAEKGGGSLDSRAPSPATLEAERSAVCECRSPARSPRAGALSA